jgi:ethanolamine ammonia-lyase large subunit
MPHAFIQSIPASIPLITQSKDRKDYVYHPETGEKLSKKTDEDLKALRAAWGNESPDVQLVISAGYLGKMLSRSVPLLSPSKS